MTVKQKVGWKVLRGNRRSCIMFYPGRLYTKGRKTAPTEGNGPLCVFKTRAAAKQFIKDGYLVTPFVTVKCLYKPSREQTVWHVGDLIGVPIPCLPWGTALADSVTCLE